MPSLFALAISLKHKFQSMKADGTDSTEVRPSNWNDEHDLTMPDAGLIGKTDAGSGPAVVVPFSALGFLPPGALFASASTNVPDGFLQPFGQVLVRADYPNLFAAIGTYYNTGGETSSQFRLPDLRGYVVAALDNMGGVSANRLYPTVNSGVMGAVGGAQTITLDGSQIPSHTHAFNDPGHAHVIPGGGRVGNNSGLGGTGGGASLWDSAPAASGTNASITNAWIGNAGGGAPHPNVQPTIVMNWLIKT